MLARFAGFLSIIAILLPAAAAAAGPLVDAAERGNLAEIQALVKKGADINAARVDGLTALHAAVYADRLDIVDVLLAAGAKAAATDRYGVTPLYLAAVNGNADIVRRLIDAGADPNATDAGGETVLMTAARTGSPAALRVLLERGARVDAKEPEFQQTALMIAVREDHDEAVGVLLGAGASPNAQTRKGPVPAFVPPCKGTGCGSEGVGINRGGLPDRGRRAEAKGGMTPLLYAARDGRLRVARRLIDGGADLELPDANGIRPLLMAALNNNMDVARLLLSKGANVNADDFWGRTPLWAAVEYRNLDMNNVEVEAPKDNGVDRGPILVFIKELIDAGANVNARTREVPPPRRWLYSLNDVSWVDFTGQTPFLRAALSGDTATMKLLVQRGADPNLPTLAGTTPLMAAAGVNWTVGQTYTESPQALIDAVNLCLELGADINATNSMGLTALLGAANRGSNDIIELLVKRGAKLDVKDKEGRTPLRWAEGVFLASVGAERKPATIALLEKLIAESQKSTSAEATLDRK
ncbi:MAG TPA: ankyrin repeat domain-containing protein [Vicinamibacterales bacterium]|nr:ankyrin repeat domain-containing protein [Vicinamibacterales bacterium]